MKAKIIGLSILGVVVATVAYLIVFAGPIDVSTPMEEDPFADWNRSGPFAINKFEYYVGENVFIVGQGLKPHETGNMVFVMPNGTSKYITIQFSGADKPGFNQYFKPDISKSRKICSINDLAGEWTVEFQGVNYPPIKFRILNQTMPTETAVFQQVC